MKILDGNDQDRTLLLKPLISIIILAFLSIGAFLIVSQHYINALFKDVEKQYRQGLINIVSVARNVVEPVLMQLRSGEIGREEAIQQIRVLVRTMTYEDQDGKNYVFMSSYDGTTLVQPFDLDQEMKNRLELQDIKGIFILKELIHAAKTHPEGSFIRYYYAHFPSNDVQEKLTYVMGLPEIDCYIATGMYMARVLQEQRQILTRIKYASIWLLIAVLIPISVSVFIILNRHKRLLAEASNRKKAEEDLINSEEKYRSIFENAVEGIFQTAPDGSLISVNPAFARSAGYASPQEMIASVASIDQHYADPEERERLLRILNEKGFVEDYVIKMKCKDGSLIWTSINSRAVKDEKGNVLYYEGTIEDITRRKEAEGELKKLAAIVRHSSELVNLTHTDGRMIFLNEAGSRMLGIDPEDVGKTRILQVIPDHLKSLVEHELLPTLLAGGSWEGELQYVNLRTGEITDVHALLFTINDPDASHHKYLANISLDISLRKQTEKMMRENEARLSSITRNMPGFVFQFYVKDSGEMGMSYASEGLTELFGVSRDFDILSQEFLAHIHEEDRQGFVASIGKAMEIGAPWDFEGRFLKSSGEVAWFHGLSTATRHEDRLVFDGVLLNVTERKQAEDKFAKVFMTTPDGIVISRMKDGRIMDVNQAFEEISGWKRGEVLGRTGLDINIWGDPAERDLIVNDLRAGRDMVHRESRLRRKDGALRVTMYSVRTIHIGGELCLLFILWDITERKRAEEELKASESMLRSVFGATPIGITFCKDRVILVANDFMCELMGYSRQELVGDTGRKFFVTEQTYEEVCREIDSQIPQKGRWSTETRHVRKDGSILDVILSGALLRAEDPSAGHVITIRDITERRRAEEEARRLRNYLSNIIDSMPSVLVGVDVNGRVTQWNAAAEQATGVGAEQAQGQPLDRVLPMRRRQLDNLQEAMRTRTVETQAKVPRIVDGEMHYEDVTVYPLMSSGMEGAVIRVDDVTERVRIEEMMVQSEKMLSVGGLAAGMAHEINNPLGVILQASQNILRRISPDLPVNARVADECGTSLSCLKEYLERREILTFLEDVRQSGQRAAEIVTNMLNFSRKAEGGGTPTDLTELLERTVSLAASDYDLKKRYDFRQIEIVREYQPEVPRVVCQAGKIQQVFLNILRNGAEAMWTTGESGLTKRFVLRVLRDEAMVRVEIEDNGPGMGEATRKRVFEPFFTTKPPGSGTGLGLSVSYFIITEDHGGTMAVESSSGAGTRFVIRLPVAGKRS